MARDLEEEAKDPSTQSEAYTHMFPKWDMLTTLLGGSDAMRRAGRLYLPSHPHEDNTSYKERLERTTLTNYLSMTLDALVGKPFSDPVALNDDIPDQIREFTDDIDLQGNDLHVFCRQWFKDGLLKGFSHVLVDFPSMSEDERKMRTLADDVRENRRPYWVSIRPENLIFASSEVVNGVEMLTHVRILQHIQERVGFTERTVEKILVMEPGVWEVWVEEEVTKTKTKWVKEKEGVTGLDIVPLVTFYSDKEGLMRAKPPLEDLGYLNVRHWQSTSDQINVLTVARFPMLAVAGAHDAKGDEIAIGPKQLLGTRDPNGKFYYVEHSGKAIEAGLKDIEKIENDMAAYGAEFLRKRPGGQTATARALDSVEATSPLQDMTVRFMDAVAEALDITAMWIGLDDGGSVEITTDFGPEKVHDIDLRTLNESRRNRDMSRQKFLEELQRRGVIADDFSYEENLTQLQDEPIIESPFATGQNVGAKPDPDDEDEDEDDEGEDETDDEAGDTDAQKKKDQQEVARKKDRRLRKGGKTGLGGRAKGVK